MGWGWVGAVSLAHHQISERRQNFREEIEDMWTFVAFVWNPKDYSGRVWEGERRGCVGCWVNLEDMGVEKGGDESLEGNG